MTFWQNLREIFCVPFRDSRIVAEARNVLSQRPQLEAKGFAETYFAPDKQAIAEKLWKITKEHSVADITGVVPTDRFVQELKMDDSDSMSLVELTIHVEEEFKISIPEGRLKEIRTFGELVDEICRLKRDGIVRDPSTSSG
jgi:acyl carrier protein